MSTRIFFFLIFFFFFRATAQSYQAHSIAFYNLENLFDAEDDPNTFDDDYTPEGRNHWTDTLVQQKIDQLAKVIVQIGKKETQQPPLLLGVSEVENRVLLERLVAHPLLNAFHYGIAHFDSPDTRGIDVGLLYRKSIFSVMETKKYKLHLIHPKTQSKSHTRDQLVVSGYWNEQKIAVLVNHWPSRRGGQKRSEAARMAAARLQQKVVDSIQADDPKSLIISMGDFNDNPNNKSLQILTRKSNYYPLYIPLFNPMKKKFKHGIGSLAFRDRWHLFDQILISKNVFHPNTPHLVKAAVFNPPFLKNKEGKFIGYPFRNKIVGNQLYGYSDHFPVYLILAKK